MAIKDIWAQIQKDKQLMEYFPKSSALDNRPPNRSFFWGVMFTLRKDYCEELIAEAQAKRAEHGVKFPKAHTILNVGITKQWANLLLEKPFVSLK